MLPLSKESEDPEEDMTLAELQALMRRLPAEESNGDSAIPPLSAAAYVDIDAEEETGSEMTDADIVMLVTDRSEEEKQREEEEEEEEEHEEEAREVTVAEALKNVRTAMQYFEQFSTTEADKRENGAQIEKLRQLEIVLSKRMHQSAKQKRITDFFTK